MATKKVSLKAPSASYKKSSVKSLKNPSAKSVKVRFPTNKSSKLIYSNSKVKGSSIKKSSTKAPKVPKNAG